jgi:hypothetical protein
MAVLGKDRDGKAVIEWGGVVFSGRAVLALKLQEEVEF